uniref:MAT-2 protein n=1 Tax=Zymoseptoria passerinii TaxID=1047170 RepID=Q86ZV8_9PEZI|nr:MAT-2 protein [Zymoseptoria passerinii]
MTNHGTDGAAIEFLKKDAVGKIKRPKNAFLIYRLKYHAVTAALNPGMHNNDISKAIGERWAAESQEVKADYKKKAEEEKRQHAIEHPGYPYKPRKPSEKKRRMTKTKLAKLANVVENARARQQFRAAVNPSAPAGGSTAAAVPGGPMPYPANLGAAMAMQTAPAMTFARNFTTPLPDSLNQSPFSVQARAPAGQSDSTAPQYRQSMLNNNDEFDLQQYFDSIQYEKDNGTGTGL